MVSYIRRWLRGGSLLLAMGLCSWLCFCSAEVMAEGIPYLEYSANDVYFYNPCTTSGGDDDIYGDGTSFKIDPDTPAEDFWYFEQDYNDQGDPTTTTTQEAVINGTKIDEEFGNIPYIYADNYDIQYTPWPPTFIPNGGKSTRKYYWITLPGEALVRNMGDKYVAYFEKRKEPVFFITYDTWARNHQEDKGVYYCRDAENDPDNVILGMYKNSVIGYMSTGDGVRTGYEIVNQDLIPKLGKLTCLHRITTFGIPLAHESGSCSGSIDIDSSDSESGKKGKGSKKEEKDSKKKSNKKSEEDTEDEEKSKKKSEEDAGNTKKESNDSSSSGTSSGSSSGTTKAASSGTKLHKPKNEWLDKAGLEGFKILKALNSAVPEPGNIDSAAMVKNTDSYAPYASDAGNGTGLPGFIVLHWTASGGVSGDYHWSIFGERQKDGTMKYYPPHFAIDVVQKKIWQYFPLSSPSGAVMTWDSYCVQIEVVGWPDDTAGSQYNIYKFTDDQYDYLAKLLIAISDETGIPLESSLKWTKGQEQGEETAPKLSEAETKKYIGVLGHEHLPNQNGKWDPGRMWEYLVKALERLGYKYNSNGNEEGELDCHNSKKKGSCGGARIAEVAKDLAWPDSNHTDVIKPEWGEAAKNVGLDWYATSLSDAQDCGKFTAVVVRKAVDMNYPQCCTWTIEEYLSNSSLWEEIPNTGSESNMEPGDVMVGNEGSAGYGSKASLSISSAAAGHAMIYIGDGKVASGSYRHRTGDLVQSLYFTDSKHGYDFRIFRYVGDGDCSGNSDDEASTGSFDDDLKKLEKNGVKVGVAVTKPGNESIDKVETGGSWSGGRAWSTIKVPLAIAAIQKKAKTGKVVNPYNKKDKCNYTSATAAAKAAISKSDNCAAWWLWVALGGDGSSAADTVTAVIRAGGDSSTVVNGTRDDGGTYLTSGKTSWSLVNQAIFAANMSSISKSSKVLEAMKKHNATDGKHGLASNYTSMVKGGWGDSDGAATRQFGLIKLKNGKCSAVAIGVNKGSNFTKLDDIAKVLLKHEDELPSGKCPEGL